MAFTHADAAALLITDMLHTLFHTLRRLYDDYDIAFRYDMPPLLRFHAALL